MNCNFKILYRTEVFFLHHGPKETFWKLQKLNPSFMSHIAPPDIDKRKNKQTKKNKHIGSYKTNICDFIKLLLVQPFSKQKIS